MSPHIVSWIANIGGAIAFRLAGKRGWHKVGWIMTFCLQPVWILYGVLTHDLAFILATLLYVWSYGSNVRETFAHKPVEELKVIRLRHETDSAPAFGNGSDVNRRMARRLFRYGAQGVGVVGTCSGNSSNAANVSSLHTIPSAFPATGLIPGNDSPAVLGYQSDGNVSGART